MASHHQIESLLIDLEAALRNSGLWAVESPGAAALASTEPFAVDTMELQQWLQFIFIPRIRFLIDNDQALPGQCSIAPMAEECFRGRRLPMADLLAALERIDALLSD